MTDYTLINTKPPPVVYYLAGPMLGYEEHNHPAFHDAATRLRNAGYTVINPAEYGNLVTGWQACMKRDIHALLWCDAVAVLPGWEGSRGATLEVRLAYELMMPVFLLDALLSPIQADHQPLPAELLATI